MWFYAITVQNAFKIWNIAGTYIGTMGFELSI